MQNFLFYTLTVLIWGSTWIAIKMQLGTIDPMVSVSYRFILASSILILWCLVKKLKMSFTLKDHFFIALQGTFLFALNYWLFYLTELYLTSGLAAVIFSTIIIMNMVNGAVFLKRPFDNKVIIGAVLGLFGISLVFKPEITGLGFHLTNGGSGAVELIFKSSSLQEIFTILINNNGIRGILLCLSATLFASFGNIISARNQKNGLPIIQTNAYGMAYGAVLMLGLSFFTGKSFNFTSSSAYISALIYLSVFGSIVAFGCYLSLIGRIGPERAAYSTLLFPIVALVISTIWENYHWSVESIIGVVIILGGNLIIIDKYLLKKLFSFKLTEIKEMMGFGFKRTEQPTILKG